MASSVNHTSNNQNYNSLLEPNGSLERSFEKTKLQLDVLETDTIQPTFFLLANLFVGQPDPVVFERARRVSNRISRKLNSLFNRYGIERNNFSTVETAINSNATVRGSARNNQDLQTLSETYVNQLDKRFAGWITVMNIINQYFNRQTQLGPEVSTGVLDIARSELSFQRQVENSHSLMESYAHTFGVLMQLAPDRQLFQELHLQGNDIKEQITSVQGLLQGYMSQIRDRVQQLESSLSQEPDLNIVSRYAEVGLTRLSAASERLTEMAATLDYCQDDLADTIHSAAKDSNYSKNRQPSFFGKGEGKVQSNPDDSATSTQYRTPKLHPDGE